MKRGTASVIGALLAVGLYASQSMALDATSSVRIALLDVSAMPNRGYTQGWPNTAGPGMGNGYAMMGMMAIRADQTSVKSGTIAFDITNWSRSVVHEMLIVSVDGPDAPLPYDYNKLQVPEEQVKVLGDSGELAPNASKAMTVELAPGSNILLCNVVRHYAAGMAVAFTVTP